MTRSLVPPIALRAAAPSPVRDVLRLLALWIRRARLRRALAELDARQLRDVGLDEARIRREIAKPFWRA